jgi:hypothetical protein
LTSTVEHDRRADDGLPLDDRDIVQELSDSTPTFPPGWSDDKIIHEISEVATDPDAITVVQGGITKRTGTRDGVIIRVIINYKIGEIITGYPITRPRNL